LHTKWHFALEREKRCETTSHISLMVQIFYMEIYPIVKHITTYPTYYSRNSIHTPVTQKELNCQNIPFYWISSSLIRWRNEEECKIPRNYVYLPDLLLFCENKNIG
jgi:hypothetical protein